MYTDKQSVANYLKRELSDDEQAIIDDLIQAAGAVIDSWTGTTWGTEPTEATTRLYDGLYEQQQYFDTFRDLTLVEFLADDGTVNRTLTAADFKLQPYNEDNKTSIVLQNMFFPRGIGNIRVTAKWWGGEAPASVKILANMLVARYLENPQDMQSESLEGYSYTMGQAPSQQMQQLIDALPVRISI